MRDKLLSIGSLSRCLEPNVNVSPCLPIIFHVKYWLVDSGNIHGDYKALSRLVNRSGSEPFIVQFVTIRCCSCEKKKPPSSRHAWDSQLFSVYTGLDNRKPELNWRGCNSSMHICITMQNKIISFPIQHTHHISCLIGDDLTLMRVMTRHPTFVPMVSLNKYAWKHY